MNTKVRNALLLHNNPLELQRLENLLQQCGSYPFNIKCAENLSDGIDFLKTNFAEVIFLSYTIALEKPLILPRFPDSKFIFILSQEQFLLLPHMKEHGNEKVLVEGEYGLTDVITVLKEKNVEESIFIDEVPSKFLSYLTLPVCITAFKSGQLELTFVNDALAEITGYEKEELKGKPVDILLCKKSNNQNADELYRALKNNMGWRGELHCTNKHGHTFWNRVNIDPVYDSAGRLQYFTWLHNDITNEKQDKEKLEAHNEELNNFMYRSTHDLRGPLNSNIGLLSLMKGETENHNFRYYLDLMEKSLTKLNENLMDLVELTKIRKGSANVNPVNIRNAVQSVTSLYITGPDLHNFELNIDVPNDLEIHSDQTLITAVLQNLIENAIKYRDQSKKVSAVSVSAYAMDKGVGIVIKDNGIGIPEKLQQKVFDMFFRANSETEGSGLGLYIVKSCLEKLQGSSNLLSREGEGTTVELFLPDLKLVKKEPEFEYA